MEEGEGFRESSRNRIEEVKFIKANITYPLSLSYSAHTLLFCEIHMTRDKKNQPHSKL